MMPWYQPPFSLFQGFPILAVSSRSVLWVFRILCYPSRLLFCSWIFLQRYQGSLFKALGPFPVTCLFSDLWFLQIGLKSGHPFDISTAQWDGPARFHLWCLGIFLSQHNQPKIARTNARIWEGVPISLGNLLQKPNHKPRFHSSCSRYATSLYLSLSKLLETYFRCSLQIARPCYLWKCLKQSVNGWRICEFLHQIWNLLHQNVSKCTRS